MDYMGEACLKKLMVWSKNIITVFHIQDNKLFRDTGGERLCPESFLLVPSKGSQEVPQGRKYESRALTVSEPSRAFMGR